MTIFDGLNSVEKRSIVWANSDLSPFNFRNCLGNRVRERGNKRLPPPPARMIIFIEESLPFLMLRQSQTGNAVADDAFSPLVEVDAI